MSWGLDPLAFFCRFLSEIAVLRSSRRLSLIIVKTLYTMIYNLLQALFGIGARQPEQQPSLKTNQPQSIKSTIIPLQYRDDVENLKSYVGDVNWNPGLAIELELKELLSICPRERKRSDAFKKLIDYLKDEQKIELIIKKRRKDE